jgi:septal ring factor EnvC (AmiA/AmiB activator)
VSGSGSLFDTLVIGLPSLTLAGLGYLSSQHAHRDTVIAARVPVDAAAYDRARGLYESVIHQLRDDIAGLRAELADARAQITRLESQLDSAQAGVTGLRAEITRLHGAAGSPGPDGGIVNP